MSAVLLAAAVIITSVALANRKHTDELNGGSSSSGNEQGGNDGPDEPVITTPEEFGAPLATVNVTNEYGFYYNQTLNNYYEHMGIDMSAEAGAEVFAARTGTIESIYTSDVLVGTQIIIDHGDGIKSVYEYVTAKEGLKAGDKVNKGDVIATVAEANGKEYKDGAHLHFEIFENGKKRRSRQISYSGRKVSGVCLSRAAAFRISERGLQPIVCSISPAYRLRHTVRGAQTSADSR